MFPQLSVAVHVLVKVYVSAHTPSVLVSPSSTIVTSLSQLSVALGVPTAGTASHSTDASAGTVSTGSVVSLTLIVCLTVCVFPQLSVSFHVLVTVF